MKIISCRGWGEPYMTKQQMLAEMIGQTFVEVIKGGEHGDTLSFVLADGTKYVFSHNQDCCEEVFIEDITGDLDDLVGTPLLACEESTSETNPPEVNPPEYQDSFLWTFYKFATRKGYVDIRWHGNSNGYYSVEVDLHKEIPELIS